jgi:hypothetical protein
MGEFDNAIDLECSPSGEACIDDDEELSNAVRYARFGENFPKHDDVTDGHIRRAVPVAYCRTWNDEDYWGGGQTSATGDFAYCILAADPNVQVVPVMMHCEADQFLAEDTVMTAVGFGREEASDPNTSGRKRFATKPLPSGEAALSSQISMGASGWTPGKPTHGDSGGPLFVQLPDDTWRVVGIAINSVDTYNTVWSRMDWLSEDPNADMNAILPCHDTDGTWNPGPSCGGFPEEPDVGFGAWQKSPACEDPNVGGASQTCVMLKLGPEPKLAAPEALPGQASDVAGPEQARGCRTGGGPPVGFRSLLLLVLLIRRTRDEHS